MNKILSELINFMFKMLKLFLIPIILMFGMAYANPSKEISTENIEDFSISEDIIKDELPKLTEKRKAEIRKEFVSRIVKKQKEKIRETMLKEKQKEIEALEKEKG